MPPLPRLQLCLLVVLLGVASAERNPRLFFASISSSTSTSTSTTVVTTSSLCYITATTTATAACKRRKKKALINASADDVGLGLTPSKISAKETGLESGLDGKPASYRDARLFLLVTSTSTVTATQTSTTTSYTATVSLSVSCIPTAYAACG